MKEFEGKGFIEDETLNIREEIEKYLVDWKWFVLGVLISLTLAFFYLKYSTPQYSANSSIMLKDNKKSGISAELAAVSDLGIVGGSSLNNTDNEIEILKSRKIVGQVVDSLNLTITYFVKNGIKETEIYTNSPFKILNLKLNKYFENRDTIFTIKEISKNEFELHNLDGDFIKKYAFGGKIVTKIGSFTVKRKYDTYDLDLSNGLIVKITSRNKKIDSYISRVSISLANKNSSVLRLSIKDPVKRKSEDFLNELVRQYNLDAILDKKEVSLKTSKFIGERLFKVQQDLADIEDKVKDFKVKKGITGEPKEAELVLEASSRNNSKIIEIQSQLRLAKSLRKDLIDYPENTDYLPQNLGFKDLVLSQSIVSYNELVRRKKKISKSAGGKNPELIEIDYEIISERKNIARSINNLVNSLNIQLSQLKKESSRIRSKVISIPVLERGIIDMRRQNEIIAGQYSYLLKKKEDADISLAVVVPNAKIIDSAYSNGLPVSPKKKIVYLAALFLGLIIPFVLLYVRDLLDTKVHNKRDLENEISVPYIGDIPKADSKEKIVVSNDARSSISEAFRLIRTNLDFMLSSKRNQSKTIFITSTTSGEGKSFISINLASTLAQSGKKVLLMGMDLRAPKVTEYLGIPNRKGVTNYITDYDLQLDDIKFNIPQVPELDIIASGVIPPNPSELLMSRRIENIFEIVKSDYDIIIVDTAPVNLVTDTLLISKYSDMFLYVVRANYLDKRLLAVPQNLYNEKRLPNMAVVLNDTDPKRQYGYGYGYGGYGYGYVEVEKPWYKKIFNKS